MNKVNYRLVLEKTLKELSTLEKRPTLLLHACCAPCSSYVLEYLASHFDITVFFYNPNIYPEAEYLHRVEEIRRLIGEICPQVRFLEGRYDPNEFFEIAKGLEKEPERGKRCHKCYRLRLREAAAAAKEGRFDFFTTTLSISPLKDSMVLNDIGREVSEEYGVAYLFSDFKKNGGYKRSIELSAQYGLYRQNYCGCVYSKRDAADRKPNNEQTSSETADVG